MALGFTAVLAGSLLTMCILFAIAFFGLTLVNLENFVLREAKEVVTNHFTVVDSSVYFRKDDQGRTLSGYLRDEGLSALVVDNKAGLIGTYGIFVNLIAGKNVDQVIGAEKMAAVKVSLRPSFSLRQLYEGRTYLTMIYPVTDRGKQVGLLILAADMDMGRQMLVFSLIILAALLPLSLVFGWIMTYFVVGYAFGPLNEILAKMSRVEVSALSEKIRVKGNKKDELVRLAASYNSMLARLRTGVTKQKEFITNVSHELKTPLTQAVLNLEIAGGEVRKGKKNEPVVRISEVKSELLGLGRLIESMLLLSKVNEGVVEKKEVKVRELSKNIVANYQRQAAKKQQTIEIVGANDLVFVFTEEQWRIILANLLANAVKYGKQAGWIKIRLGIRGGKGYLEVENEGNKIPLKNKLAILRRFYRVSGLREEGLGIGLSLVKTIAKENELTLLVKNIRSGGTRIEVGGFELG